MGHSLNLISIFEVLPKQYSFRRTESPPGILGQMSQWVNLKVQGKYKAQPGQELLRAQHEKPRGNGETNPGSPHPWRVLLACTILLAPILNCCF